tara:strand:+ start:125 stop:766 length:642 start_codon:yes stop_codon:yes gene_type:complete
MSFATLLGNALTDDLRKLDTNMTIGELVVALEAGETPQLTQQLCTMFAETKTEKVKVKVKKHRKRSAWLEFMSEMRPKFKTAISEFMTTNPTAKPAVVAHFVSNSMGASGGPSPMKVHVSRRGSATVSAATKVPTTAQGAYEAACGDDKDEYYDKYDLPKDKYDGGFTGKVVLTLTNKVGSLCWKSITKDDGDELAKWKAQAATVNAAHSEEK